MAEHTKHAGSSSFTVAMALGLTLASLGCGAEESVLIGSERFAMPTDEVLDQDVSYMSQLFSGKRDGQPFIKLDFTDPRQYRAMINHLLHAGKTPSDSPRLFEGLIKSRAAQLARLADGAKGTGEATTASVAGGNGTRCGAFVVPQGNVTAGMYHVDAHSLMSCFNGMDYVNLQQAIYRTDEEETFRQRLAFNSTEDFAGVEVRTPVLHASMPAGVGNVALVTAVGYAEDDTTGEVEGTFTAHKTEAETPAAIRTNSTGSCCQFEHPRDSTGDGIVRLCYKRSFTAGVGDCDYVAVNALNQPGGPGGFTHVAMIQLVGGLYVPSLTERWPIPGAPVASVPNLFLPMMGTFDAGTRLASGQACDIKQVKQSDTWAAATLRTTGGWCGATGGAPENPDELFFNLFDNFTYLKDQNGNGQVNDIPFGKNLASPLDEPNLLANFGPDCLKNLQDACLIVNISTRTNCSDPNNPSDKTRTATCEVCFDVRNSCFAEGTLVRRASGAMVPVEEVQVGDQIIANGTGTLVTVTAATRGVEPEPMVRLKDSLGHVLMLTSNHPVITTMGAVPAEEITTMSQVETEDGVASIVEVERVRYQGLVYNLSVGTPEELAMVTGVNRTMFAGGIRVGDNEMQFDMERQRTRERAKRELSPAWETDRKNAMARKQQAAQK